MWLWCWYKGQGPVLPQVHLIGCYPIYNIIVIPPMWSYSRQPTSVKATAGDPSTQMSHTPPYSHLQRTMTKAITPSPQLALLWDFSWQPSSLCNPLSQKASRLSVMESRLMAGNNMEGSMGFWAYENSGSNMIMIQRPQSLGFRTIIVQLCYEPNYSL